jgi:hypothetical protein
MSSRPAATSHPAFAMVCGSITFFLFGVMDHSVRRRRLGRTVRKERDIPAHGR